MHTLVFLGSMLAASTVGAGTLHGAKAESLTYALRYAGAAPTVAKGARTFNVAAADCVRTLDPSSFSEYRCTLGTTELKDAAAYLLYTAMTGAGFAETPVADTKIQTSGKSVSCVVDPAKGDEDRFACTADGLHVKPFEATIKPKKMLPKDIVQPVKIEKQ
jgi:hypothetical protein